MEIIPYRRHSVDCKHKDDRYHPRCGCPLWFRFNWSQPETKLEGKKLHRGQNRRSAKTRIWSQAQTNAKRLETDLEALLQGKPVRQKVTVKAAVNRWLEFRGKNGLATVRRMMSFFSHHVTSLSPMSLSLVLVGSSPKFDWLDTKWLDSVLRTNIKMRRRWIMIELGQHSFTEIIPRLIQVIDGSDQGGISESVEWSGGGGFGLLQDRVVAGGPALECSANDLFVKRW